jgi:hypothetical protein
MARIIVCSLLEGAFVTVTALVMPEDDSTFAAYRIMAWWVCLPALSVALVALAAFFAAMEPRYRQSFFGLDTRRAMYRRHWTAWAEEAHGEADRAHAMDDGALQRYVGEPVVVWIEQSSARWAHSPPVWCTAEWRAAVLKYAHLLPGDGASRMAAVMSNIAGSDGDGEVAAWDHASLSAPAQDEVAEWDHASLSAPAQEGEGWDPNSPLAV